MKPRDALLLVVVGLAIIFLVMKPKKPPHLPAGSGKAPVKSQQGHQAPVGAANAPAAPSVVHFKRDLKAEEKMLAEVEFKQKSLMEISKFVVSQGKDGKQPVVNFPIHKMVGQKRVLLGVVYDASAAEPKGRRVVMELDQGTVTEREPDPEEQKLLDEQDARMPLVGPTFRQ